MLIAGCIVEGIICGVMADHSQLFQSRSCYYQGFENNHTYALKKAADRAPNRAQRPHIGNRPEGPQRAIGPQAYIVPSAP